MVVCNFYDFYQNPSDCLLTTIAIIIFINRNFTSLCTQKRRGTFPNCAIILPVYHWQIKDTIHLIEHLLHTRPHLERLYFFAVFCSLWFITTVFCRLIHLETVMHRQHNQTSLFAWLPFLDSYYFFSFI